MLIQQLTDISDISVKYIKMIEDQLIFYTPKH